jgi:protoporphyrinogen oxidase
MGGHVIFSHYAYFDELLDSAVSADSWNIHERVSYIWLKNRWIPYPFQNNLYALDDADKIQCIEGLVDAFAASLVARPQPQPQATFDAWILRNLGEGIADLFMRPYNFKVWAYEPIEMQAAWLGERVATVDLKAVLRNVVHNKPAVSWGPNAVFRFPKTGGTGGIWKKVASKLPENRTKYNKFMNNIDSENKVVWFSDGSSIRYNKLLLTTPLDLTLENLGHTSLAQKLKYSSTHVVGLGLRGIHKLDKKCWLYFPEDNCPFYRCTVFSNYAQGNCPAPDVALATLRTAAIQTEGGHGPKEGPYWSLMFEISESEKKPVDVDRVVEETIQGALNCGLIEADTEIVSIYHRRLERGYPTPHLDRDEALREALPWLKRKAIWSRGRFGSWKYEVANQDHSLMIGVEAIDNMLFGTPEMTLEQPDFVNRKKNDEPRYKNACMHLISATRC